MNASSALSWFYLIPPKTEIELKFDKISKLKDGWRYGEGKAPTLENIELVRSLNTLLEEHGWYKKDAFPGVEGDLTLELYVNNYTLEITFESDDTISCGLIKDNKYIKEKEIPKSDRISIVNYLMDFLTEKCKSSDSYTSTNTVQLREDLPQSPSKIFVEASLLLAANV